MLFYVILVSVGFFFLDSVAEIPALALVRPVRKERLQLGSGS